MSNSPIRRVSTNSKLQNPVYPMSLIFAGLIMLSVPGLLFNNFQVSGLNPAFSLTCPNAYQGDFTCQNSNASGCQLDASSCTLNGNSISFLNSASPFTALLGGNILALFSPLTSNGNQNRGPFDANGGGQYYTADCAVSAGSPGAPQNITTNSFSARITNCTQTNPDHSNMTKPSTFTWANWNSGLLGINKAIPFYQIANNATYAMTCYNQGWWFITNQPNVGYSIIGCDYYKSAGYSPPQNPNVNPIYSFLLAVPCELGENACKAQTFPQAYSHINIYVQPENWDTQFCTNAFTVVSISQAQWYGSQQCTNLETWFVTPHASGSLQAGFFTPFLTILIGLILFIMGSGINLRAGGSIFGTGTTFGAGVNRQGTKLAQVMGIGLIAYVFLYSEFSTWFTSSILPYGLDGTTGAISIIISAITWSGMFWMATQD